MQSGYSLEPARTIGSEVMNYMLSTQFPWKWSQILLPSFYANSWQQDYAVPGVTNLAWLQAGSVLQVSSTQNPKPRLQCEVDRYLPPSSASLVSNSSCTFPKFFANWLPNDQLYYGTWGTPAGAGSTQGNDPVANSVYTTPIGATTQPSNPITQIRDANGNLLVLTIYGHEGSAAPALPANSAPGTTISGSGATTVWTVVDPKGQGFRILPVPSQTGTVWQFNLIGQQRPPVFTSLQQLLDPIPDDYSTLFRQGFVAYCYRRSPEAKIRAKFDQEFKLWLLSLEDAKKKSDRERDSASFIAESMVAPTGVWNQGSMNPFLYPPVSF